MKYIPHAPPFVMIDELVATNENLTHSRFKVRESCLFVENHKFTEPGLIENLAQTAAAGVGFNALEEGISPPIGFIGQVKNLEIYRLPEVGETITSTVESKTRILNALVLEGSVACGEELIAKAEFKVFLQEPV